MTGRLAVVCLSVFATFAVGVSPLEKAGGGTYEQVADNSDEGRFAASGSWKTGDSGEGINGDDYRFARPAGRAESAHALFKVRIPADGEYTVYARWPKVSGLNGSVPVGVQTARGTEWTEVDQRENGGRWVRIGEFEMRGAEEYPVRISRATDGEGNVVADAVKVVRVDSYEEAGSSSEPSASATVEWRMAAATSRYPVVAEAKKYLGVRYKHATCTRTHMSCTCVTKKVFAKFGYNLPMTEAGQIRYGKAVGKSALRPGDLVYFKENGKAVTHVGIYSTKPGYIVHASRPLGKVVESQMKYIRGYAGARRLV